ncbi:odorant receptor 49b-like [Anthonomus grandis grandis]|uniref:odorant receptor 49b-like n=1 Tax=Anthonomus grandis grandis TaxID=2921223 RepID=UPI0021661355|nr:odorant receptor 49b-like [Anthonomus grandis grandis]
MSKHEEFIKFIKYFLIIGGLWPFEFTKNRLYQKVYRCYARIQTYSYVTVILSLIINLCILIVKHNQMTRLFSSINVLIITLETCVKILIFQVKKIPNMCLDISINEGLIKNSKDEEVVKCYWKQVSYCRKVNFWQFVATLLACICFTLVHFLEMFASPDLSLYKDQPFMHDMWYPFAREKHMNLVIFFNLIFVNQGIVFNTATQTTFICLMIYSSARLKILQIQLRKFDEVAKDNGGDVLETVKNLIVEHQVLIGFVKSLNEKTNYVMLLEFVLNSISLASGTIQLVVINSITGFLSVGSIILLVVVQIFILAWSANEITVEGLGIADAICASNWNDQSPKVQKLFIIMILRAQKPLGLTAGPFFQMTTKTALMTLKVAYSYISLMMQNYEN